MCSTEAECQRKENIGWQAILVNSRHAGDICPKDVGPAADKAQARRAALAISPSTLQEGALLSTDGE